MSCALTNMDIELNQRFQRKPRVLGTDCIYAPTNALFFTEGLPRGSEVLIVGLPECKEDLFVNVCTHKTWRSMSYRLPKELPHDIVNAKCKDIDPKDLFNVRWEDLVS